MSALMLASKGGHTETVKTLIEVSADVSLATTTVSFTNQFIIESVDSGWPRDPSQTFRSIYKMVIVLQYIYTQEQFIQHTSVVLLNSCLFVDVINFSHCGCCNSKVH